MAASARALPPQSPAATEHARLHSGGVPANPATHRSQFAPAKKRRSQNWQALPTHPRLQLHTHPFDVSPLTLSAWPLQCSRIEHAPKQIGNAGRGT